MSKKISSPKIAAPKLPKEIRKSDLKAVSYKSKKRLSYDAQDELSLEHNASFELWYTERFGWCIPTLLIANARRGTDYSRRTYGVSLEGKQVRMGHGPHVLAQIRVYINKTNLKRLQHLIDLRRTGQAKSHDTRDRISTRRMRRAMYY